MSEKGHEIVQHSGLQQQEAVTFVGLEAVKGRADPKTKRVAYGEGHPIVALVEGRRTPILMEQGRNYEPTNLKVTPIGRSQPEAKVQQCSSEKSGFHGAEPSRECWRADQHDIHRNICFMGSM